MAADTGALTGVRVLDLAGAPGAYCGKLLADLGADVIAVEPPQGAALRHVGPFYGGSPHRDRSLAFWHYSTNKRSVVIDFDAAAGRAEFQALAATADVIVETFPPGRLSAWGLDYDALAARYPRLTLVSITPFGQTGPHRDYRGSDLVAQAAGGMVFVNGCADGPPLQGLGLQAYHCASGYAAIGALLALLAREHLGHGQWIDVSMQECVAAALEHASSVFHQDGVVAQRQGSLHWTRYFRVGRCRDGYVLHCTLGDWTSLIEWVKADGKAQDLTATAWEEAAYRRDHCSHLFDVLDLWAQDYTVAALVDAAQLRRLPYAAVVSPETLPEHPQLQARSFFTPVAHPELGKTFLYPGAPYRFSATPWRIQRRAPLLGEHTSAVLAERGAGVPPAPVGTASVGAVREPLALAGVRVLDFTWVVAGPVATRILADHGADVIKIERRDALDFGSRRGGLTGNLNRGKRSVVLNMNTAAGVALAARLVESADVVVDNFSARVMHNWGLDYERLRRIKPDIIAASLSGFGHTGPQRDHVSYGPTLQSLSGYTWLMHHPGGPPVGWGFSYSDMAAGWSGAFAILAALWHRRRTGEGQFIDLSQFENLVALLGPGLLDILVTGATWAPVANASQEGAGAPHGVYRCASADTRRERWCAVAVRGEEEWARLCTVLGHPPWTRAARFATAGDRLRHQADLDAHLEAWTRAHAAEDVMQRLQHAGIAAAVVADAADLCRHDPHLRARRYWQTLRTPEGQFVELDGVPFTMSHTPGVVRAPGPLLGEHTEAALAELLHVTPATLAELRAAQVIA